LRLAFSTNAFTGYPLSEAMEIIRNIGYEGVELMADRPHLWPEDIKENDLEGIVSFAKKLDLVMCNLNAFMMKAVGDVHYPSWIEKNIRERLMRREHTEACIRMARTLGVPTISTEPGGPLLRMNRVEAFDLFADGLEQVLPVAQDLGVKILIEPEPWLLLSGMEETVDFIKAMDHPWLGLNFDAGHFFCLGLDPAKLILKHKELLEHIHIEDIAANRVHHHLIPGQGAMDFKSIFQALNQVEYPGFITVELYPFEDDPESAARKAYRFLAPFLKG